MKFEQSHMVRTTRKFELVDKKQKQKQNKTKKTNKNKTKKQNKNKKKQNGFFKTIFDKALTPFWKTFL